MRWYGARRVRWTGWLVWCAGTGSTSCWASCGTMVPGRAAWPPLVLFKALLLGSLYGLSERELEEALADRLSFRRFAGLGLEESVPDHTVLNRFRNELVELGLIDKLFGELGQAARGWRGRAQARHHAGCHGDRGGEPAARRGTAIAGCRCRLCQAHRQARLGVRLQGACGGGRRLRADPGGAGHAGQYQRHHASRFADPRRRAGGVGRCGLSHPCPAGGARSTGHQAAADAPGQPASPRPQPPAQALQTA